MTCINGCGFPTVTCNCLACVSRWRDPADRGRTCAHCDFSARSWFLWEARAAIADLAIRAGVEIDLDDEVTP